MAETTKTSGSAGVLACILTSSRTLFETCRQGWLRSRGVLPLSICLAVTLIAVIPFFYIGEDQKVGCCGGEMPMTHDAAMHHNQMQGFYRGLASGRLYPRWDERTHLGYGAPTTSFYPPGAYYLTSVLYWILRDWRAVMMGFYLIVMAGSGLATYAYARETLSRVASLVAMIIYMIAPYHLINQYQRGAVAEQMGFVWAPLVLLFSDRLLFRDDLSGNDRLRDFAGLAAAFGAYLWTHPPTAYQLLLLFGTAAAIRFMTLSDWSLLREWNRPALVLGALLFGSMLAGAYFYPGLLERDLVYSEDVERTWPYHTSYIYYFAQNVYRHDYGGFFWRLDRIWLFHATAITSISVLLLIFRKYGTKTLRHSAFYWIGAGILAIFLMTRLSWPIGRCIPSIEIGVFSWRMLTFAGLSTALASGLIWQLAGTLKARAHLRSGWLLSAMVIGMITGAVWIGYILVVWPMVRGQAFAPVTEHYNYATLPRGVPRELPQMDPAQTVSGQGRVMVDRWDPEYRTVRVSLDRPDRIKFRTSYFPGWTAIVNGMEVHINKDMNSSIYLDLPAGKHSITLEFGSTPVMSAGNRLTVISFLILISIVMLRYSGRFIKIWKRQES